MQQEEDSASSSAHRVAKGSSGDQPKTNLSKLVFTKIFLHAAKYPYAPTAGFIIGKKVGDNKFDLVDVLPVCHGFPAGPVFDLALIMGDAMHTQSTVIGVYFSNGLKDSDEAPLFVNRISKGIQARSDNCVIIQLKGTQVSDTSKLPIGITNRGNAMEFTCNSTTELNTCVDRLLGSNLHHCLMDFEDHMDNRDHDFRNSFVSVEICT